jgi:hypothetical protein
MAFIPRQEPFECENCGFDVTPLEHGSCRSHCPKCLYSKHVDNDPGDRLSDCHGLMKPEGIDQDSKKGFVVMHKCEKCGVAKRNKAAPDDELSSAELPL